MLKKREKRMERRKLVKWKVPLPLNQHFESETLPKEEKTSMTRQSVQEGLYDANQLYYYFENEEKL